MGVGNSAKMLGRLTKDPEFRQVNAERGVANFSIAVDRRYKDSQGNRPTDFWDIQAWGKLAELVMQYAGKGGRVFIEGRYQKRSYQASDGSPRFAHDIIANTVEFIDFKEDAASPSASPSSDEPLDDLDGLPF